MTTKRQYGQYYTTNYKYILSNITIPSDVEHIIEPFTGMGDLIEFSLTCGAYTLEMYDIDPKYNGCVKRDTLTNPPSYHNKFVITNPPFLARNKNECKILYDRYNSNDLYKCFLETIISDICQGGILILPINFVTSIRNTDVLLRKRFTECYDITQMNIFEERVFADTTYSICSILFRKRVGTYPNDIRTTLYPSKKEMSICLDKYNNYTIGGELYNLPHNPLYKISRLTSETTQQQSTNIMVKCIDDTITNQLGFKLVPTHQLFVDRSNNHTRRSYATIILNTDLTMAQQQVLVDRVNAFIHENRVKYNSLFLSNFRDSTSIARKRITFRLAFSICNYILSDMLSES